MYNVLSVPGVSAHRHRVPRPHIPHERGEQHRSVCAGFTGHRSRLSGLRALSGLRCAYTHAGGSLSTVLFVLCTSYDVQETGDGFSRRFLVRGCRPVPPPTQRSADSGCAPARAPPKAQQPFNIIMPSRPGSRSSTYICSRPAPPRVPPCSLAHTGRRASSCREIACCGEGEVFDSRMGEQHAACAHLLYTLR